MLKTPNVLRVGLNCTDWYAIQSGSRVISSYRNAPHSDLFVFRLQDAYLHMPESALRREGKARAYYRLPPSTSPNKLTTLMGKRIIQLREFFATSILSYAQLSHHAEFQSGRVLAGLFTAPVLGNFVGLPGIVTASLASPAAPGSSSAAFASHANSDPHNHTVVANAAT